MARGSRIVEWTGGSALVDIREISKANWKNIGVDADTIRWERQRGRIGYTVEGAPGQTFRNPATLVENWNPELEAYFAGDADFKVHEVGQTSTKEESK